MIGLRLAIHRTFHSLRVRNFRLYFLGQMVSVTGTWMQSVASAWLVLQLTGSGVALGVVTALSFLPILLLGPWGGVIADRFDKRHTLVATQAAFAALAAVLGILTLAGLVQVWQVYLLSLAQGLVTAVDNPNRQSFVMEMVGQDDLTNAVSLNSAVMTGTRIVGPALAGVLIATVGLAACFLVNAVSYVAVIVGLLSMRPRDLFRKPSRGGRAGRAIEGLRYVWRDPGIRDPLVLMAVVFTLSFNFSVLFPLMAKWAFHGDAGTLGLLLATMGTGSLVGALLLAHRAKPSRRMQPIAAVAFGGMTVAVALAPTVATEIPLLVLLGLSSVTFMITGNSTIQLAASDEMRGRVMALYGMVFLGTTPIGAPIAGWMAQSLGVRFALGAGGVVAAVAGLVAARVFKHAAYGKAEQVPVAADTPQPGNSGPT